MTKKIEGAKYVNITDNGYAAVGEVVTLVEDDGTSIPLFEMANGETYFLDMDDVVLLKEQPLPEMIADYSTLVKGRVYRITGALLTGALVRFEYLTKENRIHGNSVETDGTRWYAHADNPGGYYLFHDIRLATPDEISILEAAEKEHQPAPVQEEQSATVKKAEYAVGEKVLIVSERVDLMNSSGKMDKYLGTVMTVREAEGGRGWYHMEEDRGEHYGGWSWNTDMIVGAVIQHKFAVGDRVKIVDGAGYYTDRVGELGTIIRHEDWTGNAFSKGRPCYIVSTDSGVEQALTELQLEAVAPVTEPKFQVGDHVKLLDDRSAITVFVAVGSIGTVKAVHPNDRYGFKYDVEFSDIQQVAAESQLEAFVPTVGEVYFLKDHDSDKYSFIMEVTSVDGKKVHGYTVHPVDGEYACTVESSAFSIGLNETDVTWIAATDEQRKQLLEAKALNGDADPADLPLDNPALTVGEVYVDADNWIFRHTGYWEGDLSKSTGSTLAASGSFYSESDGYLRINDYRKALPTEIAKLEAAETLNGNEYQKPGTNSNGVVLAEGQYYSANHSTYGGDMVLKLTKVPSDGWDIQANTVLIPSGVIGRQFTNIVSGLPFADKFKPATDTEIALFEAVEALEAAKEALDA